MQFRQLLYVISILVNHSDDSRKSDQNMEVNINI